MNDVVAVAHVQIRGGRSVERLACHPRLPLVAGLDSERPTVHVWEHRAEQLHEVGSVGAEPRVYGHAVGWERAERTPAVAWHPDQPLLVVAGESGVLRWTPAGLAGLEDVPPAARYRSLAFSPDGRSLWASPSAGDDGSAWDRSDVLDLASGTVASGPPWDTGVAEHPAGGLVATFASDQGATLGLFAKVDDRTAPATMRVLDRALILDADGYETPVFSPDGSHLAIRGNAYQNSLEVFEFPSLRRILATTLGGPGQLLAWARRNIAFGSRPGLLWVGTPTGRLVEVDLETGRAVGHDVLAGSPVSALAATAQGELLVAGERGDLVLLSVRSDSATTRAADGETSRAAVIAFLDATSEVPDDGDLESHLVMTDGDRTWESDELETVTAVTQADPTWLQLQAALNEAEELSP